MSSPDQTGFDKYLTEQMKDPEFKKEFNVSLQKIANEAEYEAAVEAIEFLWDSPKDSKEHKQLLELVKLVHEYEGIETGLTEL